MHEFLVSTAAFVVLVGVMVIVHEFGHFAVAKLLTAEELRGAGLRVTAARAALLETVRDGDHLGVEAIASGVRDRVGHVSLQAVYEALHAQIGRAPRRSSV